MHQHDCLLKTEFNVLSWNQIRLRIFSRKIEVLKYYSRPHYLTSLWRTAESVVWLFNLKLVNYYRPPKTLRESNVFSRVCPSVSHPVHKGLRSPLYRALAPSFHGLHCTGSPLYMDLWTTCQRRLHCTGTSPSSKFPPLPHPTP